MEQIVCCTDFSQNAQIAFEMALEMAEKYKAGLTILHVMPPPVNPMVSEGEWTIPDEPKEALTLKIEKKMQEEYGGRVPEGIGHSLVILDGHVSSEIIDYVTENPVDVVIIGSYGLTGMELVFFGSVAKRVAHKAPCSVLIARR
jgi:universal stress protein A